MNLSTLAGTLAVHMAEATGLEEDKIDTVRFGLEIILGAIIKGVVLFSSAYLLGVLPQVIAGLVTAGIFRMLSGGAHCTSYSRCLTFGVLVYLILGRTALFAEPFITANLLTGLASFVVFIAILCSVKWVPGEVPYRIMNGPEEIIVFKALSLVYLLLWLGLVVYFAGKGDNSILLAATLALGVQTFSFTPIGYWLISHADGLMIKLRIGGETHASS